MQNRINIQKLEPKAYQNMFALESYLQNSSLSKMHLELIKIRASQINGCSFCIDLHTKTAIENGETQQRIFLLSAWKDATVFTEQEKVILAMTEEITLISKNGLSNQVYTKAQNLFDENYIAQIIMAISIINVWNRIAISTNKVS